MSYFGPSDKPAGRIDYGGISASRLEALEDRLKDDVLAELAAFGGRYVIDVYSLEMLLNTIFAESSYTQKLRMGLSFLSGKKSMRTTSPF